MLYKYFLKETGFAEEVKCRSKGECKQFFGNKILKFIERN